ncbi:MAG: 23S rRNA (adenine(2503)-C(2))-methyltransferase RlmN [Rhodospirillales bacterium]|nr:23S rRNA (adenine(2503)-C(2))-methyltransferase RlmN [Alphaproteobacteria bacterium]MCB9986850.1 23S rRNA (adenine(2503)-C(2))-methyltransferase RlmN [Rhodospirillales bacterium]USO08388.1 MAG: 23S rRNA (adenine(2503)-C(2))-methyltransferase RlmN [Rhodospirillales bacterium]
MSSRSHDRAFAAPKRDASGRIPLIGLDLAGMQAALAEHGLPAFRAKQVWHWVYQRGAREFSAMANIPREARALLEEHYSIDRPGVVAEQRSADGTIKWLLGMSDGQQVETVFIPDEKRGTLCISSQVGCTLTCKFCHTGTQPLVRNLGVHEILQQVMHARDVLEEWPSSGAKKSASGEDGRDLTNIVLMGMGEPLYNYENVAGAMRICMDPEGLAIGKRRITLSTSGVVPMIERCGRELNVNLAISLHGTTDEQRSAIMPINNKYPLEQLMQACRTYPGVSNVRRITFEYVMLKGVNDTDADAQRLIGLLRDIPSKVNLIPFNPWPGTVFECSSNTRIDRFSKILTDAGLTAPVRRPRGRDILAACGQLRSESRRARKEAEVGHDH